MEIIEIPRKKILTAEELYEYKDQKFVMPKTGLKRTKFENTEEEKAELNVALENLRKQITNYRIERASARSQAEWQYETQTVKLTRKVGKFNSFGYSKNGQEYLRKHEALYLIDMNRLELYFDSLLVSIEQAYFLLLGEEKSKNYDRYFVYSFLTKCGYVVQLYENNIYSEPPTIIDCIWEILQESLNPNHKIAQNIKRHNKFNSIKHSINNIKDNIKNYKQSDDFEAGPSSLGINFNCKMNIKRKLNATQSNWPSNNKKIKLSTNAKSKSLINILTNEPEYEKFRNIFEQFGSFQLPSQNDDNSNSSSSSNECDRILDIDFDLYFTKNFQRSKKKLPILRVIILRYDEDFPNYSEITKCYNSQKEKVPLVVIPLSQSNNIQGFLYHFN